MAARFKFRLEALLKLRHSLEEQAQRALARSIAAQEQAQARLAALQQSEHDTIAGRAMVPNQVIDLERWAATERYLLVLKRHLAQAAGALEAARNQVAAARAALLKAHQDHLMLVRLKERRMEQYALEVQRTEAREMDEIAVLRYRLNHATSL
jgi:flagellar FliJ protein